MKCMKKPLAVSFVFLLPLVIILLLSCSGSKPVAKPVAAASPATISANVAPGIENDILNLINQYRQKKGLPALQSNFVVTSEARRHTMQMATRRVPFGHNGMAARARFIKTKLPGVNAVAENVAYGNQTAEGVVSGWLNSPGHKKNIEGRYRLTGIGVARDVKSRLYFTQIFTD